VSKTIPAALVTHKASSSTTLTDLLRVGPLDDGTYRGFTLLDADVTYASLTYKARTGMELSAFESTADLGVDNAEANTLYPVAGFELEGFTDTQIDSGALDKIPFVVYRVNYESLSDGHEVIAGGTIGEVRRKVGGLTVLELRSLSQQLKQTVGSVYTLTCPATFGSQPIGTGGGVVEERKPCGFDFSSLWVGMTVTAVDGDEPDLVFSDSTLTQDDDYFAFGMAKCTGGANLDISREIDGYAGGQVVLRFSFPHPVEVGDTFDIRPGCSKRDKGDNSCRTWWSTEWVNHFRGFPHMPIAEANRLLVPGAALNGRYSGTGEEANVSTPPPDSGGVPPQTGDTDPTTTRTRGATIVTVAASYGDGVTDATSAINAAITSLPGDGGTVVIPDGTYLIDPTVSIQPVSNMWLKLSAGTVLKSTYTALDHKYAVLMQGLSNVEISGGTILGYRDLWAPVTGTTSEWGHCIACYGCAHVTVRDITLRKAVGDGMSIGGHSGVASTDVVIDNVLSEDNRRQGLSIVWADGVTVSDSTFQRINGTSPECGIDIEPESGNVAQNITITNCKFYANHKYGINILKRGGITATVDAITITGCTVGGSSLNGNLSNGIVTVNASNVTVSGNTISYNKATGLRSTSTTNLAVSGNTFLHNYTQNGIDNTDTAHLLASGLNSPQTDPHVLIVTSASGQSITNNTFWY
jgi:uncharacterized phage protein (TIGR02218 family)